MNRDIPPEAKLVTEAVDKLGEHFDSVIILVTRHEASEGGTFRLVEQRGNLYANLGWAQEWLASQHAITRRRAIDADRKADQEGE